MKVTMSKLLKYFAAGVVRYWLMHTDYWQTISNRVEIATPLNSWKRLTEGVYLYDHDVNPYEGDAFHESPIMLIVFHFLMKKVPYLLPLIFTIIDLITAHLLYKTAKSFVAMFKDAQESAKDEVAEESKGMLLQDTDLAEVPNYVLSVYLFNPYSVLNCVGMTTTVVQNVLVTGALWSAAGSQQVLACLCLALATHQALYPVLLIVPISLLLADMKKGCNKCSYIRTLLIFVLCWGFLTYISAFIMDGSYDYLNNTYGLILTIPNLKPNIGLFWYFFTEMFEHFRLLFICAFQINALALYIIPLTLRFKKEPVLLATVLIALSTIFRSYPCVGDVGFYLALLPLWKHLFSFMQQKFIVGCAFIITSALGPTVWHLWIYSGSANANFFFGVTLSFATAQIFLITDLLFAYIKREFTLKHGTSRDIDGRPAKLVLR
ncbi:phosphatidylinositol glycan anchor biosynthesis class U protein [Plutella xylostella]|uniref:phosphatidylinositol glycan anchor biosynthesis class U protein n=1 Tax=Plutella xylostella TaxID=51655 RepID=UPI0020322D12|nr:phosphatidylinositol glycan anchor biosynthesis class U protein [Plutella xylostella]